MYISNVKKTVIFFFSRFFLKKRREKKYFFRKKTLKKKRSGEDCCLPPQPPSFPSRPSPRSEVTVALWERMRERGRKSACLRAEGFRALCLGCFLRRGLLRGGTGGVLSFFFFFFFFFAFFFFFCSEGGIQSRVLYSECCAIFWNGTLVCLEI